MDALPDWNAVRYDPETSKGHVESYFLKANDARGRRAVWLKATIYASELRPAHAVAEAWAIVFDREGKHVAVKESVFPFDKLPEVDPVLGPEMRSTGEVLGLGKSFGLAFYKAEEAASPPLPLAGTVLISSAEKNAKLLEAAREFVRLGFDLRATRGTHEYLAANGVQAAPVQKLSEGRPNIVDEITNRVYPDGGRHDGDCAPPKLTEPLQLFNLQQRRYAVYGMLSQVNGQYVESRIEALQDVALKGANPEIMVSRLDYPVKPGAGQVVELCTVPGRLERILLDAAPRVNVRDELKSGAYVGAYPYGLAGGGALRSVLASAPTGGGWSE